MRQVLGPGALGRPRGIGWRGRWEGWSGWGIHVTPWLIHFSVWQNPLQCCEVISLQPIKINEKKKREKKTNKSWLCHFVNLVKSVTLSRMLFPFLSKKGHFSILVRTEIMPWGPQHFVQSCAVQYSNLMWLLSIGNAAVVCSVSRVLLFAELRHAVSVHMHTNFKGLVPKSI